MKKDKRRLLICKLVLTFITPIYISLVMLSHEGTISMYMWIMLILYPIITWFVVNWSLKKYGEQLNKDI